MNEFVNSHKIRYSLIILAELADIYRFFFLIYCGFFGIITAELTAKGHAFFFDAFLTVFLAAVIAIKSLFLFFHGII